MADQPDWTEPGAYEVAPGVHRVPLALPSDGLRAVNVYVLQHDSGLTLIDGGWAIPLARTQLEEALRTIGAHPRDITSFLVTHAHRDHYTQAAVLRTELGVATIAIGAADRPNIEAVRAPHRPIFADRLRRCGAADLAARWEAFAAAHRPDLTGWELPDSWIEGEPDIVVGARTLRAVPTPGHTRGHYVFADTAAGLLFAGDHVLPTITPSVGFETTAGGAPLRDFMDSLVRVRALPDLRLLPAHGPVAGSTHARVAELLAHHEHRLEASRAAVAAGHDTPAAAAAVLPWTRREQRLADLDDFNAGLAVMETELHLDLLALRGVVERLEVAGVLTYRLVAQGDPRDTANGRG